MPKVIECEECGFKFSGSNLRRQMKDHLYKLHGKTCLWPCGKCNAEFDTRHLLSVHTCSENLVPLLKCEHAMNTVKAHGTGDFCECTFVGTQTQLNRHYKTSHLREYARICPYCSAEFTQKSNLQRHLAGSCLKAHIGQKQGPILCVATQAVVEQSNSKETPAQVTVPKAQVEVIAAEDLQFSQMTDDMRELPTMVHMFIRDGPPGSTTNKGDTTLKSIIKSEEELKKFAFINNLASKSMKNPKGVLAKVSRACLEWLKQQRSLTGLVTGVMLKEKALSFNQKFGGDPSFQASDGWVRNFKFQYVLKNRRVCGEKGDADLEGAQRFESVMWGIVYEEELSYDAIYNADESGLIYRKEPTTTYVHPEEKSAAGHKQQKERLTFLTTCNASGTHKLQPVMIGKAQKPRCFINLTSQSLPVRYFGQKSAWMTGVEFENWFKKEFVPEVKTFLRSKHLPLKAVLLVDNAKVHPADLSVGDIRCIYLPPNTASIIQPCDQGIIAATKKRYQTEYCMQLIAREDAGLGTIPQLMKAWNVLDAILTLVKAWRDITARTIISSWKKVLPKHSCSPRPDVDSATEPEAMEKGDDHSTSSHTSTSSTAAELEEHTSQLQATCDELQSLVGRVGIDIEEWDKLEQDLTTSEEYDDDGIVEMLNAMGAGDEDESEDEDEDEVQVVPAPRSGHGEFMQLCSKLKADLESRLVTGNPDEDKTKGNWATCEDVLALMRIMSSDKSAQLRTLNKRQMIPKGLTNPFADDFMESPHVITSTLRTQLCPFKYTKTSRLATLRDPMPFPLPHPAYPCGYCKVSVQDTDYAVSCDECKKWFHCVCIGMPLSELAFYETEDAEWFCNSCLKGGYKSTLTYTNYLLSECTEPFDELDDSGIGMPCEHDPVISDSANSVVEQTECRSKNKRPIKKHPNLDYVDINIKSFQPVRILNAESIAVWRKQIYKCSQCSFTNPSPCVIKEHRKIHRGFKLTCPYCEYFTNWKDRLDDHIAQIHGGVARFACSKCSFTTTRGHHLKSHTAANCAALPHKCDECEMRFKRVDTLREHVLTAHTDSKVRFKCTLCSFQSHRVSTWNRHKQTHTNLKPYPCTQCDASYKRKYQLTEHVRSKHGQGLSIVVTSDGAQTSIVISKGPSSSRD